jgi:hypothetical protein
MPDRLAGFAVKSGATTLALILGTVGLALAGVNLPDPAQQAFERAGISLPNQAGGESGKASEEANSDEVRSVLEATPTGERGCDFGHRVAEAAKGSALPENARTACEQQQGSVQPSENGSRRSTRASEPSASGGSEFGQQTAERAQGLGDATVEQRREFGKETSEEAKQLGSDHPTGPPANTPSPPPAADPSPPDRPLDAPPATTPPAPDHPTGPPAGTPGGRP